MGSWHFEDRRGTKRELQRFGSIGVERRAELSEMSVWGVPTGMPQEGKSDMERIGLFKEMGYIGVGDKYTPFTNGAFNESAQKRKQMLCGFPKKKCGLQVGYFDNSFKRIFEKEASTDPVKLRRLHRIQQAKKNLGTAFVPSDGGKRP